MVSRKRWLTAQTYERSYWERLANRIVSGVTGQLSWYEWKTSEMEKRLGNYFNTDEKQSAKVLEIGSGPVGIVSFLKWGKRYTVDPLEEFYRTNPVLTNLRDPVVYYAEGNGEQLSFKDLYFSLVILDNVLDHVHEAGSILKEIYRVLSEDGLLYLAVNVHAGVGTCLHSILSRLKIDKGHPYTFTIKSVRCFLDGSSFSIVSESISDYYQAREQDRRSASLKSKIKGYTGLSEFVYYAVCQKKLSQKQ